MKTELYCYYCDKEFIASKGAKGDHIIPDALGGRITFLNVCKECNDRLNREADLYLIKEYKPLTILFGIRPEKNKKYSKNEIEFDDFSILGFSGKVRATLSSNGVRIKNQVIELNDKRKIRVFHDKKQKHKFLSSNKSDKFDGYYVPNSDDIVLGTGMQHCSSDQEKMVIRSLVKSCLNLIGFKRGLTYLKDLELNQAREFALHGTNFSDIGVKLPIAHLDKQIYKQFNHVIRIYKEEDTLMGLVFLFGQHGRKITLARPFKKDFDDILQYFSYTPQENF
ncbi:HNH endonuclease [Desulfoscipio gibsoniae]|uniref:HNH endonuclease 5 domain-containing protein n=1 Tax=Desulfoscipio gibsoniae DSM 7213 TaxID=767817 RepID=R4KPW8_9FIRM|nr:HNH endonuclease [Desulfoscipio gibsoniae]AGL01696.1 hypothetical protein Desgi_2273 [Desulfoscipio gibsoniae DSM 7213]